MPAASDRKSHLPLSMALSRGAGREQLNFHINRDTTSPGLKSGTFRERSPCVSPRAWPCGSRVTVRRPVGLRGHLPVQPHRRVDGCLSGPTAWFSPGPLAERVPSSTRGQSTLEIGAPPRPEGRGVRAGSVL